MDSQPPECIPCAECGALSQDGACGQEGTAHAGSWYCSNCWREWDAACGQYPKEEASRDDPHALMVPEELVPVLWLANRMVTIASLGAWCGVKMAMRAIGVGGETLPFDWVRISMDGLLAQLRGSLSDFLEYSYVSHLPHSQHFVKEGSHSFFHDNLDEAQDRIKYNRRIERFLDLRNAAEDRAASSPQKAWGAKVLTGVKVSVHEGDPSVKGACHTAPILFIRALNTTLELLQVGSLFTLLVERYGPSGVFLLLLLDHQPHNRFFTFADTPGLLLSAVSHEHSQKAAYNIEHPPFLTAYHEAIGLALWYLTSGELPLACVELPCVDVFFNQGCDLMWHVSLGEDLTTSMSYDPHMPSAKMLQHAASLGRDSPEYKIVTGMVKTHAACCSRTGMLPHMEFTGDAAVSQLLVDALASVDQGKLPVGVTLPKPDPHESWEIAEDDSEAGYTSIVSNSSSEWEEVN